MNHLHAVLERFDTLPRLIHDIAVDENFDLTQARRLVGAVCRGHIKLHWQSVRSSDGHHILYYEALSRIVDDGAEIIPAGGLIAAAERIGLVSSFDHYVVSRVIDELEAAPAVVLGVNISAQCAQPSPAWAPAMARLRGRPDIARRLVIEITETADFRSLGQAIEFASQVRALGCRLAIDDFGDGKASIRRLLALRPDIVKIDRFFAAKSLESSEGHEILTAMVRLAQTISPTVIVEGVETEAQSRAVQAANCLWQQGYFWGVPLAVRPWQAEIVHARRQAVSRYEKCSLLRG